MSRYGAAPPGQQQISIEQVPTSELPDLLDILLCEMDFAARDCGQVARWLAEILARSDADSPDGRHAIDACVEHLSLFGAATKH